MMRDVETVLNRVACRQGLVAVARAAFLWTCILSVLLGLAIVGGRLLALWSDFFTAWMILVVPVLGGLLGWLLHRRAGLEGAARAADRHCQTEDLFLTNLAAGSAPGEYQPLVERSAVSEAGKLRPGEIVPLPFVPRAVIAASALALLWVGYQFLPQLDPFGSAEERILLGQRSKRLAEEIKSTQARKKVLKDKALNDRNTPEVEDAMQEVVKTFRGLRKSGVKKNERSLRDKQGQIGRQWRASREKNLASNASQSPSLQRLGRLSNLPKFKKWQNELSAGKSRALRRELKELRDLVDQLSRASSERERQKIKQELAERTKDLAEFLKQSASSRELNETLAKALNQLQGLGQPRLSKEAEGALKQSFELSEMELKALAQSMRNMKDLESAMQALQAARQANAAGQGKGGPGEGPGLGAESGMSAAEAMEAYLQYYEGLLAEGEESEPGEGMGGPGRGEGGIAPEDPSQQNAFKTEMARSALKAGKILMNLKTKEAGDRGEVTKKYTRGIRQVKQGVSEAILQERVPPGYHHGIRKYFDDLGEKTGGKAKPGGAKKK